MSTEARSSLSTLLRRAPTRYQVVDPIAAGGMAEVWRGDAIFEEGDRHPVAIKRVLPRLARDPMYRSMFLDEARLGMLLRHRNIVRVYDGRDAGGTYIMIMEMVDGTSLKAILERAHQRAAGMPVATALYMVRELAQALEYAHTATDEAGKHLGIIHRDVSPHNLLLSREGEVKLADFGLADASVHRTQLADGMLGGKLGYLAPEIIRQRPSTHRVDIFAAGIVLWECLCGRRLFHGHDDRSTVQAVARCEVAPPSRFNASVPPHVDALVADVLAEDPDRRISSASVLVDRLSHAIDSLDPAIGSRDVALMVGLHMATSAPQPAPIAQGVADLLAQELAEFVAGQGADAASGATPLDPDAFGGLST